MLKTSKISPLRYLVLFSLCSVFLIFYVYTNPPNHSVGPSPVFSFFEGLSGDLSSYASRFLSSFLFLGLLPFLTTLILGIRPSTMGLRRANLGVLRILFFLLLPFAVLIGLFSSFQSDLASFYPYSMTLQGMIRDGNWLLAPLHAVVYLIFYYIPWEFFFRGLLIMPLIHMLASFNENKEITSSDTIKISLPILIIASFQAIPSAIIHIGHPISETLSALFFGIFLAYLAVKTKSIIPGLVLHSLVGISLDLSIIFIS